MPSAIDISRIPGAEVMTPLQMNAVHFSSGHTALTPELLARMRKESKDKKQS